MVDRAKRNALLSVVDSIYESFGVDYSIDYSDMNVIRMNPVFDGRAPIFEFSVNEKPKRIEEAMRRRITEYAEAK